MSNDYFLERKHRKLVINECTCNDDLFYICEYIHVKFNL